MAVDLDGPNSAINVNTIETHSGSTLTLGKSGDTVTLGSGVTTSGFQKDGAIAWDSSIKSANTSITSGAGFFVDTTSAAITITLPASPSVGDIVGLKDYAGTFGTNNLTIARNGSNIQGNANDSLISTNRASVVLVYADATKGWLYTNESNVADLEGPTFISATGGTITTSGNYKIHTFTSSGTFTVSSLGNPAGGPNNVDYMVVAAGGGGGAQSGYSGGGAGGGGFRESVPNPAAWTASPLASSGGALPVSVQGYPISIGAGGVTQSPLARGTSGGNSIFSTITSAGGGGGGGVNTSNGDGGPGGSGGGGGYGSSGTAGSGNTPSVSPPQGSNGGSGGPGSGTDDRSGGGGGATQTGTPSYSTPTAGDGGDGATTSISASSTAYSGGGGGGGRDVAGGTGGTGGGGSANPGSPGLQNGTANTGGGAAGASPGTAGGTGGSGIVIIRYKFQ